MKALLFSLAQSVLRRCLHASAAIWADLKRWVKIQDQTGDDAAAKHERLDAWLRVRRPFDTLPHVRRRLIQAAVLCVRIEEYLSPKTA